MRLAGKGEMFMFMNLMRTFGLPAVVTGVVLAIASPARAQQPARPASTPVGIYLAAQGGALLQPRTAAAFGVEFGERIHRHVVTYAALSYFEDLMDTALTDQLATVSRTLTARTARSWDLRGRDRGVGLVVGAKYLVGTGTVKPYVGAGAGALALHRTITDSRAGDVTAATFTEFNVGDASLTTRTVTRPLTEASVGVDFDFGRTHVDVGYRYRRAFHLSLTPDFSQAVIGVGVNF